MQYQSTKRSLGSLWIGLPLLAFTFFLAATLSFGQIVNASLTGTVTDPTGAAIPDATVTATETATGQATKTTTDPAGNYNLPSLAPGNYTLRVEKAGLKSTVVTGITLLVNQQAVVNAQLQVGDVTTTVEVQSWKPLRRASGP